MQSGRLYAGLSICGATGKYGSSSFTLRESAGGSPASHGPIASRSRTGGIRLCNSCVPSQALVVTMVRDCRSSFQCSQRPARLMGGAVFGGDVEGLLEWLRGKPAKHSLPFEIPRRRHDAAPRFPGRAKGWLLRHRPELRIDELVADLLVLGPGGHKVPTHRSVDAAGIFFHDRTQVPRRRDIPRRVQVWDRCVWKIVESGRLGPPQWDVAEWTQPREVRRRSIVIIGVGGRPHMVRGRRKIETRLAATVVLPAMKGQLPEQPLSPRLRKFLPPAPKAACNPKDVSVFAERGHKTQRHSLANPGMFAEVVSPENRRLGHFSGPAQAAPAMGKWPVGSGRVILV